ncbi:OPT superfamily [Oleoguttula sp. CCFEE 5521]
MSPDRGSPRRSSTTSHVSESDEPSRAISHEVLHSEPSDCFLAARSSQPQFTFRALLLGLTIGVLIAFSNTYFGLQTGWISGMAMPSALIGFAYFKGLRALMSGLGEGFGRLGWGEGFSEVENVLVQTVAGSVGTMPLGCGFVGVIPALEYLLRPGETPREEVADPGVINVLAVGDKTGGFQLPLSKLVLWALGICFFGVVFAVPLRKEVIVREKLKFPSGTATALMISVLHGGEKSDKNKEADREEDEEEGRALIDESNGEDSSKNAHEQAMKQDWKRQIRLLTTSFGVSGAYTLISYFIPQLHALPIFGTYLSNTWLWELNPSPAYVGQGIIMGPATTIHMLLGAILGWGLLSPLAKQQGWASGDVGDWNTGSKGWIVWVSLAIMLADAIVSLGWLILRPLIWYTRHYGPSVMNGIREQGIKNYIRNLSNAKLRGYSPVNLSDSPERDHLPTAKSGKQASLGEEDHDAPPEHLIGVKTTIIGAILSLTFCVVAVRVAFNAILSIPLTLYALVLALLLSIMGVRALGETDLNPVSGISKLTQLLFAFVTPASNPNAVVVNLLAGAISEAGALQAGDLLQDLKTGHLLGASPKAQFWGQLIGSAVGAVVSACVYKLYTAVYTIPSGMFQVPTAYVWVFTARLVTGSGLPPHTPVFAGGAAAIFAVLTIVRIYGNARKAWWVSYVPGGIAVAVGMYNTPSFTLARTAGGVLAWWWTTWKGRAETPVIVLASGLILGEGLFSIVNLGLASGSVGHL